MYLFYFIASLKALIKHLSSHLGGYCGRVQCGGNCGKDCHTLGGNIVTHTAEYVFV